MKAKIVVLGIVCYVFVVFGIFVAITPIVFSTGMQYVIYGALIMMLGVWADYVQYKLRLSNGSVFESEKEACERPAKYP